MRLGLIIGGCGLGTRLALIIGGWGLGTRLGLIIGGWGLGTRPALIIGGWGLGMRLVICVASAVITVSLTPLLLQLVVACYFHYMWGNRIQCSAWSMCACVMTLEPPHHIPCVRISTISIHASMHYAAHHYVRI